MFSGCNVKARHELLTGSIGVFTKEIEAYDLVMSLFWILPTMIFIGALMDALFIIIYMRFAHPWIKILSKPNPEGSFSTKTSFIRKMFGIPKDFI